MGCYIYTSTIFYLNKGSLHEKKTEIVWSFTKPMWGGVPPNQTPKRFPAFSLEKKRKLYQTSLKGGKASLSTVV